MKQTLFFNYLCNIVNYEYILYMHSLKLSTKTKKNNNILKIIPYLQLTENLFFNKHLLKFREEHIYYLTNIY